MNPDQNAGKLDAGNSLLDTFIKQSLGIQPMLPFPRGGDTLQWIQTLHALELQGWPWVYPKVQMQKCDKCALEFFSSINYRRHVRVHRRSLNIDKDFPKNRDCLRMFWDKLSTDKSMEILSFKNIALEGVSGLSVLETLATLLFTTGFAILPKVYVKAGVALLDVIQARPSVFPISSEKLFSILDDASEKTFLCAGTAISLQKFVFDGEIGKIGLQLKNVVAFTCFLLEQQLIKAWIADKDAEALRCQNLLMEEEETAQKRQAKNSEKRRLRKLRQMEQQKAKIQIYCEKTDSGETFSEEETSSVHIDREEADSGENYCEQIDRGETSSDPIDRKEADFGKIPSDSVIALPSVETSGSQAASDKNLYAQGDSSEAVALENLDTGRELDSVFLSRSSDSQLDTALGNVDSNNSWNVYLPLKKRNTFRQTQATPFRSQHGVSNGFRSSAFSKQGSVHKQSVHWEQKHSVVNSHKVWTPKTVPQNKPGNVSVEVSRASTDVSAQESRDQPDQIIDKSGGVGVLRASTDASAQESRDQPDHIIDKSGSVEVLRASTDVSARESRDQPDQIIDKSGSVEVLRASTDVSARESRDQPDQFIDKSGSVEVLRASTDSSARESRDQPDVNKCEVLIGLIPVTIQEGDGHSQCAKLPSPVDQCAADKQSILTKNIKEKHAKPDLGQSGNRSVKVWRSVNKHEVTAKGGLRDSTSIMNIRVTDQASSEDNCLPPVDSSAAVEAHADPNGPRGFLFFCARSAEAFLIRRWKKAISGEHVMLVLPPETEPSNHPDHQNNDAVSETANPNVLCCRDNRLSSVESLEPVKQQPAKKRSPKSRAPKR